MFSSPNIHWTRRKKWFDRDARLQISAVKNATNRSDFFFKKIHSECSLIILTRLALHIYRQHLKLKLLSALVVAPIENANKVVFG